MTSKERAALRARANGIQAIFQIGKGGISEELVKQTDDALNARELIKLKVLETAPLDAETAARRLADDTGAEVMQVLGRVMTLYRYNPELHKK